MQPLRQVGAILPRVVQQKRAVPENAEHREVPLDGIGDRASASRGPREHRGAVQPWIERRKRIAAVLPDRYQGSELPGTRSLTAKRLHVTASGIEESDLTGLRVAHGDVAVRQEHAVSEPSELIRLLAFQLSDLEKRLRLDPAGRFTPGG